MNVVGHVVNHLAIYRPIILLYVIAILRLILLR
jgi:hypothetical protein